MRTVRRLYFYVLALIGSQALVWGAVNLLRTIVDQGLAGWLALVAGFRSCWSGCRSSCCTG
jgi:hypothetical protein